MQSIPTSVGWSILALVFVDEVLACVAMAVYGASRDGWLAATVLVVLTVVVWWTFASPRAPFGGTLLFGGLALRPLVKVVVFGLAATALWGAGHPGWALAFLAFSALVNAAALHPDVARLTAVSPLQR